MEPTETRPSALGIRANTLARRYLPVLVAGALLAFLVQLVPPAPGDDTGPGRLEPLVDPVHQPAAP